LVLALKNLPNHRELVPRHLWKYLDEHIVVSGWYPERDVFELLEVLVGAIDPAQVGGDAWRFLGIVSAQRDIGGSQSQIPIANRVGSQGLYRSYGRDAQEDAHLFIKRAVKLWSQYHDTGTMEIRGGRAATNTLVVRLIGFQIPIDGYVRLQVAYTEEYGRLVGVPLEGRVVRSTARGDPFCEWDYTFERTAATEAFIRSLDPLP
jgi:hypothetical protein